MNCRKVKDILLTDYIDGELPSSLKKTVDLHLEKCAGCRKLLETASLSDQGLKHVPLQTPPEMVWNSVLSEITEQKPSWRDRLGYFLEGFSLAPQQRMAVAFACLMVIVFTGIFFPKFANHTSNYPAQDQQRVVTALRADFNETLISIENDSWESSVQSWLL